MDLRPSEIKTLEVIQVLLLTDEGVEEPTYARVMKNNIRDRTLLVLFLNDDGFLDRQMTKVSYDSVLSHWEGETDIWDVSGVEPVEEDHGDDEMLEGFVVEDKEEDLPQYTDERRRFDKTWDDWEPDTPEGIRYKNMVNRIEEKYC